MAHTLPSQRQVECAPVSCQRLTPIEAATADAEKRSASNVRKSPACIRISRGWSPTPTMIC
eukprot:6176996-Pleurochrysis_carterae.AAC.1